ncbi:unnamed protein product [Cuscuta epithymum]|uniref:Uncharacterized protein n=1 Tax=Cuscuta epithymum TaxID=186058 RepID=A0AAV0FZ17_9ASTE|nr:unnamed protein product [Cuscuta epithymum]
MKELNDQVKLLEQGQDFVVSEERMDANLLGYSKCEVTVNDMSCAPWKFDKLLFRKKTVWKVCDKRTNTLYLGDVLIFYTLFRLSLLLTLVIKVLLLYIFLLFVVSLY